MDNENVRQISDEEVRRTLTKEELQQTQVLNYKEVQKAIRFEKITSKKPAILIAILGVISLLLGGSLQVATVLQAKPQVQKRDVTQNIEVKNLVCAKTTLNNPDNTNTVYNITYKFENDKLVGITKEYNVSAVTGKEEGKKSIEKYITEYKELLNDSVGYIINIETTENTAISVKVVVDLKKFDLTKFNEIQQTKSFTKVDYTRNSTYDDIREDMIAAGFTVE